MNVAVKLDSYKKPKFLLIAVLGLMSAVAPLATDMYLPALESITRDFHTTPFLTQLSIAFFFFAFASGQLFYGPLSDAFGRKKPLYIGLGLFIFATFGCVLTTEIESFIVLRFFQALGGCAAIVIARAMVTDLFDIREASGIYAMIMMVSSIAPMLAPSLGEILLHTFNWQAIFYALLFLGVLLLVLIIFLLPETHKTTKKPLTDNDLSVKSVLVGYMRLFKDIPYLILLLTGSLIMGGLFAYIGSSSFLFMGFYHLSTQHYAWLFGLNALGVVLSAQCNAVVSRYYSPYVILRCSIMASVCFGVGLVIAGVLQEDSLRNFIFFESMLLGFIFTLGFILPNTTTLAMARHKQTAGMASALLGAVQFAVAGSVIVLVGMVDANTPLILGVAIALCLLVGGAIYYFYPNESLE